MGSGKSLLGSTSVYAHACRSRNQGGYNGKFRAIVLCPDHLISKWEREIQETIPDCQVFRFENWKGIVGLLGKGRNGRWTKPEGPEFYILGRNQAKWYPDWLGVSDPYRGFGGRKVERPLSGRTIVVDREVVMDEEGKPVRDRAGNPVKRAVTAEVFACPRCGTVARDKKGLAMSAKDLSKTQRTCEGLSLQMLPEPDKKGDGLDRICPVPRQVGMVQADKEVNHGGHRWMVKRCGEPLYCWTSRPYRWAPARIIQKKMRRAFQYLIIDEVHEQKSDESAQSMAAGKLMASVRHTVALTGTIIGGYADHLYPLMMRMNPESLRHEGFEWGKSLPFSEVYGRIDRIVTTKESEATTSVSKSVRSMRRAKSGATSERKAVRPGIMPTLFGRHMIGSSVFITLDEMAEELPDLYEYIGGPEATEDPYWVDTCCSMLPEQKAEYDRVQGILDAACKELLRKGSMKLLGAMLWTLMDYPDKPYGWTQDPELVAAIKQAREEGQPVPPTFEHSVGYWNKPGSRKIEDWVGVVTPRDLDQGVIYPKEEKLIEICKLHQSFGHQTWVYVQMTGKRNVQPRLKALLEKAGLRVGVLRSGDVDPKEREDWIAAHGREYDVMICHPKLVSTGLDLFSKVQGGHNYNCIVFYQTGYNLFDMRQAARRAWRIGQPRDCFVYYLYYRETMQHRAMSLMSRKLAAAQALEGEFSEEGLAAMAGEDNLQMALAKSLAERIDESDMQRSWSKIKGGEKKARRPTEVLKERSLPTPKAPAPMPPLATLIGLSDAQRAAFKRLSQRPDRVLGLGDLHCITATADALVEAGLAEKVEAGWRCRLAGKELAETATWLRLYPGWSGLYLPLGVVRAMHPAQGECYVRVVNHQALPKGVEFLPVDSFPFGNSIPICANEKRLGEWRLVSASDEDRRALNAAGLFLPADAAPGPLDALPIPVQMVAEEILESQSRPAQVVTQTDIEDLAERMAEPEPTFSEEEAELALSGLPGGSLPGGDTDREEAEGKVEPIPVEEVAPVLRLVKAEPEPEEEAAAGDDLPELTEEILAKMFANMLAHGMDLADLAG